MKPTPLEETGISECCSGLADSVDDQQLIDSCFEMSQKLSEFEKASLYYISAYIAFKEGCPAEVDSVSNIASEFLDNVNRGRLAHPPQDLYDVSHYFFSFFKNRDKKCCPKVFIEAFKVILSHTEYKFANESSILGRFINCFLQSFSKKMKDVVRTKDPKSTKKTRIAGS